MNDYSQIVVDLLACYHTNCKACSRKDMSVADGCVHLYKEAAEAIADLETQLTHLRKQKEKPDPTTFLQRIGVLDDNGNLTEDFRDIFTTEGG